MNIIELKVSLEYVQTSVTRVLQVPSTIRLDHLHLTLQAAMGWTNSHLYMFEAGGRTWGIPDPDFDDDTLPASKTSLVELLENAGAASILYVYDFGDNWEHKLEVVKYTDPVPAHHYPRLTEVTCHCPPEDVGGIPGYEEFLDTMANSKHPEHSDLMEWYDGPFDPNTPDTDELRLEVLRLAKRWKTKKKEN